MNQNSNCLLCGKRAKLLKKSHVIPSFMYKGLFDETSRMMFMPISDQSKAKYIQTGYYDKYVLCGDCDNALIGRIEKYAAAILYGGSIKDRPSMEKGYVNPEMDIITISGLSYTTFKLFILSILWRAHISWNKFFEKISVPDLEPDLRRMLLNNDAGFEDHFRVALMGIKGYDGDLVNFMPNPDMRRGEELNIAHFIIGGVIYFVELIPKSGFVLFDDYTIRNTGELKVPIVSGEMANRMLKAFGIPDNIANHFTPGYKVKF